MVSPYHPQFSRANWRHAQSFSALSWINAKQAWERDCESDVAAASSAGVGRRAKTPDAQATSDSWHYRSQVTLARLLVSRFSRPRGYCLQSTRNEAMPHSSSPLIESKERKDGNCISWVKSVLCWLIQWHVILNSLPSPPGVSCFASLTSSCQTLYRETCVTCNGTPVTRKENTALEKSTVKTSLPPQCSPAWLGFQMKESQT